MVPTEPNRKVGARARPRLAGMIAYDAGDLVEKRIRLRIVSWRRTRPQIGPEASVDRPRREPDVGEGDNREQRSDSPCRRPVREKRAGLCKLPGCGRLERAPGMRAHCSTSPGSMVGEAAAGGSSGSPGVPALTHCADRSRHDDLHGRSGANERI